MDELDEMESLKIFEKHRLELVSSVDTDKQFIQSYLRSKFVLDDEDCQRISSGTTRQDRVSIMLNILALKGPAARDHFITALEFEHPNLYESITGKKPEARITPVPIESKDGIWNWTTGIEGKSLIDFDRQFLARQLDRAMTDLKCMTYWQSKIMEEKNILEKKLFEATDDLQLKEKYMQDLQEEILELASERRAKDTVKNAKEKKQPMHDYVQELWRDNMERSNAIIALQSNLLLAKEQMERLQKANSELATKNQGFKDNIRQLTIINDYERRASKKMSETVVSQTTEADSIKKELLKWKFKCGTVTEERDALQADLDHVQKWTEVLNERFDAVNQEKNVLKETSDGLCSQYSLMQDQIDEMEAKNKWQEFKYERSLLEVDRLKKTLDSVRDQRNSLNRAKEDAIQEKNDATTEKAQLNDSLQKLQQKYHSELEKSNKMYDELYNQHVELLDEMRSMESRAADAEKELKFTQIALERMEQDNSTLKTQEESSIASTSSQDAEEELDRKAKSAYCPYQRRNRESLIESIRRKVSVGDIGLQLQKGFSLPTHLSSQKLISGTCEKFTVSSFSMSLPRFSMRPDLVTPDCNDKKATSPPANQKPGRKFFSSEGFSELGNKTGASSLKFEMKSPVNRARQSRTDVVQETRESKSIEPFRERLYLLTQKEKVGFLRTRSTSVPPSMKLQVNQDAGFPETI